MQEEEGGGALGNTDFTISLYSRFFDDELREREKGRKKRKKKILSISLFSICSLN